MLMMPETVKINPLMFQVPIQPSMMSPLQQQQPPSGLYQRQPRSTNNAVSNRGVRRHIRDQESSSPNASTSMTPRTSHRSRTNRYSTELESGIRFEEPPLSSSSSSGHLPQQQQQQQQHHRSKQSRSTSNSKSEDKSPNKTEEARSQSQMTTRREWRRQRAYSNEWDLLEDDNETGFGDENSRRNVSERKSIGGVGGLRRGRQNKPGPMETLDRRISASTDQLDTLKREKKSDRSVWGLPPEDLGGRHSRGGSRPHTSASCHVKRPRSVTRHNHPEIEAEKSSSNKLLEDSNNNEITIDYRGEKISKNRYFFGDILHKTGATTTSSGPSSGTSGNSGRTGAKSRLGFLKEDRKEKARKTAVDLFLEDAGPYSRKLYGPPPPSKETNGKAEKVGKGNNSNNNKRARSQEVLLPAETTDEFLPTDFCPLKKGLLWQQRDKLFSRWKERYFVLTKDYFHCFKKATSKITEMGGFIFKLKLVDIDTVELLDKRGYLTICMSLLKEGKIYLRRPEGIRDWYNALQNNIYESKRRKKFWVKRQVTDSSNIEQWLLARQKVGIHYPLVTASATGSSPNLLETSMLAGGRTTTSRPGTAAGVDPDSGHDDEELAEGIPEVKKSGEVEEPRSVVVVGPRGINRLNLVTELIMKEKLSSETCPASKTSAEHSSGDSLLGESSSSSARSSMQSSSSSGPTSSASTTTTTNVETSKLNGPSSATTTSKEISSRTLQHRRLDDSGNDSGHNSMNTNSDTQSDATNSSGEEAATAAASAASGRIQASKNMSTKSLGRNDVDKMTSSSTALAHGLNVRILVDDPCKSLPGPGSHFPKHLTGPKSLSVAPAPIQGSKSLDSDLLLSSSPESESGMMDAARFGNNTAVYY